MSRYLEMGRKQLNIKFREDELEQLQQAKQASGKTYHDLILEAAGVKGTQTDDNGQPKRKLRIDGEAKARENPGLDAEEVDGNPGEDSQTIRPAIEEALYANTPLFERTDLPAAARELKESGYTWKKLNEAEKETILLELDGLEEDEHLDRLNETAKILDEDAIVLARQTKRLNRQLVDLSAEKPTPTVLDALKRAGYFWWQDSSPDLLGSVRKISETLVWDRMEPVDRAILLSHVPEKEDEKLPEIANLLGTDEAELRSFRDRLIKTKDGYKLRPETK
jgi:predicted Fe-S protein YdhL (DUF1289 family)